LSGIATEVAIGQNKSRKFAQCARFFCLTAGTVWLAELKKRTARLERD
jgi:hypothetical protein